MGKIMGNAPRPCLQRPSTSQNPAAVVLPVREPNRGGRGHSTRRNEGQGTGRGVYTIDTLTSASADLRPLPAGPVRPPAGQPGRGRAGTREHVPRCVLRAPGACQRHVRHPAKGGCSCREHPCGCRHRQRQQRPPRQSPRSPSKALGTVWTYRHKGAGPAMRLRPAQTPPRAMRGQGLHCPSHARAPAHARGQTPCRRGWGRAVRLPSVCISPWCRKRCGKRCRMRCTAWRSVCISP